MRARDTSPTRAEARGNPALAEVSLLLAVFFVGMDVVSVKYALEGFPPLVFMPIRYVLAGLLLLATLRLLRQKDEVGIGPRDLLVLAVLGLVGITLNQVGYTVGLSLTSGSNASLVFATTPVWGLLLGVVLRLERGSWMGALGLGLAIAGVALVVGGGLGSEGTSVGGDLLVCVSAFSWGAYAVLSLPVLRRFDPFLGRSRLDDAARRPCSPPLGLNRLSRTLGAALLGGMGFGGRGVLGGRRLLDGAVQQLRHSRVPGERCSAGRQQGPRLPVPGDTHRAHC